MSMSCLLDSVWAPVPPPGDRSLGLSGTWGGQCYPLMGSMHDMDYPKRTKSVFPPRDPTDPADASVQIMIRVPHWYAVKLQSIDRTKTIGGNVLAILANEVPIKKPRRTVR